MSFSRLMLLSVLAVVILSIANASIIKMKNLEASFHTVENDVENVLKYDVDNVISWTRLSPAVKTLAVKGPFSLVLPQENKQKGPSGYGIKSSGFSWASCGPSDQLVDIRNLSISPSPLFFPGKLSFGFDIVFHDTIASDAQVSASLLLEYSARTGSWIKIPCIGQIGSCNYDDVCSLSQAIVCPDELRQRGIPCTCPINKGEYKLPNFDVEVDASIFLAGDYQGKVVFTESGKGQIACYQVTFTIG